MAGKTGTGRPAVVCTESLLRLWVDSLRVSHWGPTGEISTASLDVELLVERPAICEVTLTYARMLCRATGLVLLAVGLIDDFETDQRIASGARRRLKGLRLHVTKLGVFCRHVVGRGAVPLPRFKCKTTPLQASYPHTADSRHAPRFRLQPTHHRNPRAPTMLSLRFSLYHFTFNP